MLFQGFVGYSFAQIVPEIQIAVSVSNGSHHNLRYTLFDKRSSILFIWNGDYHQNDYYIVSDPRRRGDRVHAVVSV